MLHNQFPVIQLPSLQGPLLNTAYDFFIGAALEVISAVVTSAAGVVTLTVEKTGGGNLTLIFSNGPITLVGTKTIALTLGSDASPQINFVYIRMATPTVLTKSTSGFPTGEEFVPVGEFLIPTAARVATYGTSKTHLHTDHIWDGVTEEGHLEHLNEWIRSQPGTWSNGTLCTPTLDTGPSPDTLTFAVAAGEVLQLHLHDFPAFDSSGGGTTNLTTFFMPNHTSAYTPGKNLYNFRLDTSGNTASNNDRIIWVVWGVVSQDAGDCKVFVNLPSDFYNSDAAAIADGQALGIYSIPAAYSGSGFLIAKLVYKYLAAGGGSLTLVENRDLRGSFPSHVAGGSGLALTVFPDNVFAIENVTDPTKEVVVDASGITTGNIRTITMADEDIDLTPDTGSFASEAQGTTADAALPTSGGEMTGDITMDSTETVDGRDISVDGARLDAVAFSFATVAAMVAATNLSIGDFCGVENYTASSDSGVLFFEVVAAATGTDDGGSFIDLNTLQAKGNFPAKVSVKAFGAEGDDSTDDTSAIQAALDFVLVLGGDVLFPHGAYKVTSTLTVDFTLVANPPSSDQRRINITGEGKGNTVIKQYTNSINVLNMIAGFNPTGAHAYLTIGHLAFAGASVTPRTANGLSLFRFAYLTLEELSFHNLNTCLLLEGCLSSGFQGIIFNESTTGVISSVETANPNANVWTNCEFRTLTRLAYEGLTNLSQAVFVGCQIEGCGTHADSAKGGMSFIMDNGAGPSFYGCYFQVNEGGFDVKCSETGGQRVAVYFAACNFDRISSSAFVTNNLIMEDSIDLNLNACTFTSFNTYVPDAGRPYLLLDSTVRFRDLGCRWQDGATEGPTIDQTLPYAGWVDGSAGVSVTGTLPNGWSVSSTGTGVFTVTHGLGHLNYSVIGTTSSTGPNSVQRIIIGTADFRVVIVNTAHILTDEDFSFMLCVLKPEV